MNIAQRLLPPASHGRIVVRCLGSFAVEDRSGDQLYLRGRKACALLAYMAVSRRPATRETLADMLWSDRGEQHARASLRQALVELRRLCPAVDLTVDDRYHASIDHQAVSTDLALIVEAAAQDDWPRLHELLANAGAGLLTDLDGLDCEFDDWLRGQRAHEPARTLGVAVAAASRCLNESGARAAHEIVAEILRLDLFNEEAVRLAFQIDAELGDAAALHRHYEALGGHLREEFGAEPSAQTTALFERLANESKLQPARREMRSSPEADPVSAPPAAIAQSSSWSERAGAPIAAAILAVAATLLVLLLRTASQTYSPAASGPVVIAVLPFEQQAEGPAAWLAAGLWDDTRAALSRNPSMRVLGRATTTAMAERHLTPEQFRRRFGVEYLLEGTVRRSGSEALVSASLTRTSDGLAVWEDSFRAPIGQEFAPQDAIANAIEGRLRARLAPGGGRRADEIATLPEVQALYSEARALILDRKPESAQRARLLLQKAVALDSNYAPAWAGLAETTWFIDYGAGAAAKRRAEGLAYAERALALAPQLAQAHAIHGFLLGEGSRRAEIELEVAVALDPNRADAWNWLGNARARRFAYREAAAAYERAVEIDPLWWPAVGNLAEDYLDMGDQRSFDRLTSRLERDGADPRRLVVLDMLNASWRGNYADAMTEALKVRRENLREAQDDLPWNTGLLLIQLGYGDEAAKFLPQDPSAYLWGENLPVLSDRGSKMGARDFWLREDYSAVGARALVRLGRERALVETYRAAFATPDDAVSELTATGTLRTLAPTLAVALRKSGNGEEANYLLEAAAKPLEDAWRSGRRYRALLWALGRIRASQGRTEEALRLMGAAVNAGAMPDGLRAPLDLAQDPAFGELRGDPRFQALRNRILAHIAKERAKLGPLRL